MESNGNGAVIGNEVEDFLDFPDFPTDFTWNYNPHQDHQDHSFYNSSIDHSSSFPSFNNGFQEDYANYLQPFPDPNPPFYGSNPNLVPHQTQAQSFPTQTVSQTQPFNQPSLQSQAKPASKPSLYNENFFGDHTRDYNTPSPLRDALSPNNLHGRDYRTPTPTYRDLSPNILPHDYQEPMERMTQLTKQSYGGYLAASAAAAEVEELAQAARRNSPPNQKKVGAEETVRDVLQRQYQEKKKMEAEMQLLRESQSQLGLPKSFPPPSPKQLQMPSSSHRLSASSHPVETQLLEHPATPATPIFTFPPVTPKTPQTLSVSPPKGDVVSLLNSGAPLSHPGPALKKRTTPPSHQHPPTICGLDIQKEMLSRIKNPSLVSSLRRAHMTATKAISAIEKEVLGQSKTVVQSLLADKCRPSSSSSSRKRSLEEEKVETGVPLKPGPRMEINEKGEKVERVYVLVHHCNANDPEYAKDGVMMPIEEYQKQAKRDDMITFTYSSVVTPYEYVDWRVKRAALDLAPDDAAAFAAAQAATSSQSLSSTTSHSLA